MGDILLFQSVRLDTFDLVVPRRGCPRLPSWQFVLNVHAKGEDTIGPSSNPLRSRGPIPTAPGERSATVIGKKSYSE